MAKKTLRDLGVNFEEIDITNDAKKAQEMFIRSQRRTVPQIFINESHLGGNDDLQDALHNNTLKQLLQINSVEA